MPIDYYTIAVIFRIRIDLTSFQNSIFYQYTSIFVKTNILLNLAVLLMYCIHMLLNDVLISLEVTSMLLSF